ncbi:MAG: hypothetical protein IBJ09_02155 [Bacteroidia bacterium]|nr:hypothetical protein [Bacteroidia bacterium]
MSSTQYFYIAAAWIGIGIITFFVLLWKTAPYGRHSRSDWGPMISNKLGWFFMEFFVLVVLWSFLLYFNTDWNIPVILIVSCFSFHYINRSIIFPLRIKTKGKKMPVVIMFSAMGFNLMNGFLIGYFLTHFATYDNSWLRDPRFIAGMLLFLGGMYINWKSDTMLISLRKPGETGYTIPRGFLFNSISCPNLFGEIIEWGGFALLTWSMPGLAFFVWTFANLVPRALSHHNWYLQKFPDYPAQRKAVLPGLW